jgi:F-type H+-transporting ATPase subunit a
MRRRLLLIFLLLALLPVCAGFASETPAGPETGGFSIGKALFEELLDNPDRPYARLTLFSVGGFTLAFNITKHFILMPVVALLVLASMLYLARKLRDPFRKPTRLQSVFEAILEFMRKEVYEPVLGSEGKRFHLLCFTFFLFILYANLLGMVPPFAPLRPPGSETAVWIGGAVTGNLATTLGLGLVTFVVFNVAGMQAKGIAGYWKGLVPHGTPVWMAPFTFLLEVVGLLSKTLALIMRLFANMIGGHVAILLLLLMILKFNSLAVGPVAVLVDLAISALEIFVAVLQAFIFSFLTALFIGIARQKH